MNHVIIITLNILCRLPLANFLKFLKKYYVNKVYIYLLTFLLIVKLILSEETLV